MTIHLCRDYVTQNIGNTNRTYIYGYVLSLFLRRVLKYTLVGATNFNINSVGPLLIATGDSNPTGNTNFPSGTKAGINIGAQREFFVTIPPSVRTVSAVDMGRILVLRSATNPRHNSGLFLIVGFDISSNSYIIDYRTLGEHPPIEAADSIEWYLYEKDANAPVQGTENNKATGSYRSDGNSTTPRVILQSPHALGWQVRICNESPADVATSMSSGTCPTTTVIPGFDGDSSGDFVAQGRNLHAPLWYNTGDTNYQGTAPGLGDGGGGTGYQARITMCGDDTGQGVTMYNRIPLNYTIQPSSSIITFGLAENEPAPLPIYDQARLFILGTGYTGSPFAAINDGSLLTSSSASKPLNDNTYFASTGSSASTVGVPIGCAASFWAYVTGTNQGTGPTFDQFASDNPFTSSTELLPIDLIQGTVGSWGNKPANVLLYAPRNMGSIPHLRSGRANFGDFSLTTDNQKRYQHLRRGLYIPWRGPNLIP